MVTSALKQLMEERKERIILEPSIRNPYHTAHLYTVFIHLQAMKFAKIVSKNIWCSVRDSIICSQYPDIVHTQLYTIAGLNILDLIHTLAVDDDESLQIQCERFTESMTEDDSTNEEDFVASHQSAFNNVFTKVSGLLL